MARRIVLLNGIPAGSTIALIRSPSSAPLHDGMSLMLRSSLQIRVSAKSLFGNLNPRDNMIDLLVEFLVLFLRKISDTWAKQIPIWCTNLVMVFLRDKVPSGAA
ncbi:hypothetical protein V1477_001787 [Vespula maculifrons]|uniref:Uncharacterized protein n=1 Tax=Vespula maculifrons TaxID=7453 RepID=A0ABD2CXG6_VESMC